MLDSIAQITGYVGYSYDTVVVAIRGTDNDLNWYVYVYFSLYSPDLASLL